MAANPQIQTFGRSPRVIKSVSPTHIAATARVNFEEELAFAVRLYGRINLRDVRSHRAVRTLIAQLGLVVRQARRDPETANAACRKAKIVGKRLEVRVTHLITGRRNGKPSTVIHRWANAACYIAEPLNGDEPPATWKAALRYINRRGGYRNLADLYAGKNPPENRSIFGSYTCAPDTHEQYITPLYIFTAMGCKFDLDPASPGAQFCHVPAAEHYTFGGLERPWYGFCFLNPPYGRGVINLWVKKFAQHRNGVALVHASTATGWFQELASHADLILLLNRKIPWWNAVGEKISGDSVGSVLIGIGDQAVQALLNANSAGLGMLIRPVGINAKSYGIDA
jgi:hypothetical protein